MAEQRDAFIITSTDIQGLVSELNQAFSRIGDRFDRLEGLRDDPTFWSQDFTYKGQSLSADQALRVTSDNTEIANFSEITDFDNLSVSNMTITTLTANRLVSSDTDKKLVSVADLTAWIAGTANEITVTDDTDGTVTLSLARPAHKTGTTLTVNTGTLTSGTITDTQTWSDGNVVNVSEVTGSPGFDVEIEFTGVTDIKYIGSAVYYAGSSSHHCQVQIYDYQNTTWKQLWDFTGSGLDQNYRFSDLPDPSNVSDYISSGTSKIRYYHPIGGNASHDLYIDYAAIIY